MKFHTLLCLIFFNALPIEAIVCPEGFEDSGEICYSPSIPQPNEYIAAEYGRNKCKFYYNAFLYIIQNAFQNSHVQTLFADKDSVWLGLHCFYPNPLSCTWDNGKQIGNMDYSNFVPGHPNPSIGACVYMDVQNGKWYSSECFQSASYYGCSYIPGFTAPECPTGDTPYLNGSCYVQIPFTTANETIIGCQQRNVFAPRGSAISIHSPGENSFIRDYFKWSVWGGFNRTQDNYGFIGLETNIGNAFLWSDGTPTDYYNFGGINDYSRGCALMQFGDFGLVDGGQWVSVGCNETPDSTTFSQVWSSCSYPYVEDRPLPPVDCSAPIYLNVNKTLGATFYSPEYPLLTNSPMVCTYIVTVSQYKASVSFDRALIDFYSSLMIYDGTPDEGRFLKRISNVIEFDQVTTATGNVISVVFKTTGQYADRFLAHGSGWIGSLIKVDLGSWKE